MSSVEDLKKALTDWWNDYNHLLGDASGDSECRQRLRQIGRQLATFQKEYDEQLHVPRKQLSDLYFETVADIHRYYEDIMERFNDDDMSVEQKDELLSTRFLRLDYFPKELKVLLEASDSLSPKEVKDVAIARKELASGKCKTFKTADEMIVDLHEK